MSHFQQIEISSYADSSLINYKPMIYVYVSLSFTFPLNFTDLINRQKINANMLKKEGGNKTFKCHKGGRAIYWRYFISNHSRKKNVLPITEKSRRKTNFSLPVIEHIFMYITRLSCGPMHCGTSLAGTPELFLFGIVFLLLY